MEGIAELPRMAKKMGRPPSDRDDVAVKIDRTIVTMARFIANKRAISVAKLLSDLLEGPVNEQYAKLVLESQAELKKPKKRGSK